MSLSERVKIALTGARELKESNSKLRVAKDDLLRERDELVSRLSDAEKHLDHAKFENDKLASKVTNLKQEVSKAKADLNDYVSQLEDALRGE